MNDRVGLDTNVALRSLVDGSDDLGQIALADEAIAARPGSVHLNLIVLAEMIWLVSHGLKFDRIAQAKVIRSLLENPSVDLAERASVETALKDFEQGGAGFTDHLIGDLNRRAGCATTLTFDKTAGRNPAFTHLA